jgi:hypothetical protein
MPFVRYHTDFDYDAYQAAVAKVSQALAAQPEPPRDIAEFKRIAEGRHGECPDPCDCACHKLFGDGGAAQPQPDETRTTTEPMAMAREWLEEHKKNGWSGYDLYSLMRLIKGESKATTPHFWSHTGLFCEQDTCDVCTKLNEIMAVVRNRDAKSASNESAAGGSGEKR